MNLLSDTGPSGIFPAVINQEELDQLIGSGKSILLYFSTPSCQVCHALKPRLKELLSKNFPLIQPYYIDAARHPEIAARYQVFTVPVLILYMEGRETIRKSRYIHLDEFQQETDRVFRLLGD